MGPARARGKRQGKNRIHRGAQVRWAEHFAAVRRWRAGARGDARGRHNGRGRHAEREDDPVCAAASGRAALKKAKLRGDFEVRGEVIMTRKAFEALNRQQERVGGKIFVNPRNSAAGAVRVLDPTITADRKST